MKTSIRPEKCTTQEIIRLTHSNVIFPQNIIWQIKSIQRKIMRYVFHDYMIRKLNDSIFMEKFFGFT